MKQLYVILLLIAPYFLTSQNTLFRTFHNLDPSSLETGILYNNYFSFAALTDKPDQPFSKSRFLQALNELGQADIKDRFPEESAFREAEKMSYFNGVIPLAMLFSEFETLRNSAIEDGSLSAVGQKIRINHSDHSEVFDHNTVFILSPLRNLIKGNSFVFRLSDDLIINTTDFTPEDIQVDFNDGKGFRSISKNQLIPVTYSEDGLKVLKIRMTVSDREYYTSSTIKVLMGTSSMRNPQGPAVPFTSSITPDLSAYGEPVNYPGQAEYQIFPDTVDGILDKPIIVVDGFDPGDSRNIDGLYASLGYTGSSGAQNLADYVRSQGFDVVILNFPVYTRAADMQLIDGGADFIERNAMLLVDLIETINADKNGTEQNVIIGPSMGGLISRYALNYMENQGMDHDTRLYLSVDSPHRGANVPIGLQHQLNYLAFGLDANSVTDLQPLIEDFLKSAAARQMLVDHFESHLEAGSNVEFDNALLTPLAHPWKAIFEGSINSLTVNGFPQNVRNVCMINGSGIGSAYQDKLGADISPGFTLLNDIFDVAAYTTADLGINFTPSIAAGIQPVSEILVVFDLLFPVILFDVTANAQAFPYSDGVDAGPGGLFNIGGLTGDLPLTGITADFLAALQSDYFNFIPSVSGLALDISSNGEINWYHDIDLGPGNPPSGANSPEDVINSTPFVNWYMPDNNQEHVSLTEANVTFALSEIIPETLSEDNPDIVSIRLKQNPVESHISLLSSDFVSDSWLVLTDLMGREVFRSSLGSWSGQIDLPLSVSSGLYLLDLYTSEGKWNTKLLVR